MLTGKIALVTGAGSGIGRATSLVLAREGAKVIVSDQNEKSAEETLKLLSDGNHMSISLNVVDCQSITDALTHIIQKYSGPPTVLVNSAGITRDSFLLKMSSENFDDVVNINLKGTFNIVQAVCGRLVEAGLSGSIVTMSSIIGQIGNIGQANYAASKAGVEAFSKSVAKEMGTYGIRCNAVVPGFIETPMTEPVPDKVKDMFKMNIPLGRFGKPSEVAELIAFLASDRSSYVNGTTIKISGGL